MFNLEIGCLLHKL